MPLRNGPGGYGVVTKVLHWVTVVALVVQFLLGYGIEAASELLTGTDDSDHDEAAVFVHGWLGGGILVLTALRLVWRTTTPLPPWSDRLTSADRKVESWIERALYVLLCWIPLSGMALLLASGEVRDVAEDGEWVPPLDLVDDDVLLGLHVAGHVLFYVALAIHVGLAVRRRTLSRMW
ncbi:cytochrome B561 [Beutenbergia cavernae DSM 12333]|uniref:Cytochrome B561 n=1 Tax=Beutenbergia cavernae (strain ATCC BAA-8 / DSM 12333 / CCUG 43141 / JCM 11478 / NBRC 16432 / NCIMB 13614 / HKI 0122) TaxID=471853 RepID=C5C3L3_BEUC1|nr:cytochrome b/b6 domain-containing protein [Beutenbergia cavernae]ACQ81922.1 cytochrome B561 [Beutenbergia cavernae DSM 12333]